jgi:hypothetical protein
MKRLTTRELADLLGTDEWRIRRLFDDGTLPEPERFGGKRAIAQSEILSIIDALRSRGWLPEPGAAVETREASSA